MSKTCPVSVGCQISDELARRLDVQVKLSGLSKNRFLTNMVELYVLELEVSNQSETEVLPLKHEEKVLKQEENIADYYRKYKREGTHLDSSKVVHYDDNGNELD